MTNTAPRSLNGPSKTSIWQRRLWGLRFLFHSQITLEIHQNHLIQALEMLELYKSRVFTEQQPIAVLHVPVIHRGGVQAFGYVGDFMSDVAQAAVGKQP